MTSMREIEEKTRTAVDAVMLTDEEIIARMVDLRGSIPKEDYMRVIAALEGNNEDEASILKNAWTEYGFRRMAVFIASRKDDVVPPDWT